MNYMCLKSGANLQLFIGKLVCQFKPSCVIKYQK